MIQREWKFPISFPGTLIDVETTAISPRYGELITFGFFTAGGIRIYQRTDPSPEGYEAFKQAVSRWHSFLPRPYHAYNSSFEQDWLGTSFDHDLFQKWRGLAERCKRPGSSWCNQHGWVQMGQSQAGSCPVCGKPTHQRPKWPSLEELISMPHKYFGTEVESRGREVPLIWQRYAQTGDRRLLLKIIYHNLYDLIRSSCLLLWDETAIKLWSDMLGGEKAKPRTLGDEFRA